jgi:hypothetical protein
VATFKIILKDKYILHYKKIDTIVSEKSKEIFRLIFLVEKDYYKSLSDAGLFIGNY